MRMQHIERELTKPVLLCDSKGQLNPEAIGYARRPFIQSNLKKNFMRKKKWNSWSVFGEDILFSAMISHLDYTAVCIVYFLNYETQRFFEKKIIIPTGRGVKMPENILDNIVFTHHQLTIQLLHEDNETRLSVNIPDFDGETLHAELDIFHPPEDDSLNVIIPRSRDVFHFTGKHHSMPTTGFVKLGNQEYNFNVDHSFSILDYGRGVWPRHAMANWAMASQRLGHRRIGLNFGGKWTDGTGMTENAVFIDGKMIKIHEDVIFTYDLNDFNQPWTIKTKFSNHVDLKFTPFFTRTSKTGNRFFHTNTQQLVGYFDGRILLPHHPPLHIRQMLGSSKERTAKW